MPTTYKLAQEVDERILMTMERVLRKHLHFLPLLDAEVNIEVLCAFSDKGRPVKMMKCPVLAKAKVVKDEERARGGPDVRIVLDAKAWGTLGRPSQESVFAHELYHLKLVEDGDGGFEQDAYDRPVVKTIPDDWLINGFGDVAAWYGEHSIERRSYVALSKRLGQLRLPFGEVETREVATDKSTSGDPIDTAVAEALCQVEACADPAVVAQAAAKEKPRAAKGPRSSSTSAAPKPEDIIREIDQQLGTLSDEDQNVWNRTPLEELGITDQRLTMLNDAGFSDVSDVIYAVLEEGRFLDSLPGQTATSAAHLADRMAEVFAVFAEGREVVTGHEIAGDAAAAEQTAKPIELFRDGKYTFAELGLTDDFDKLMAKSNAAKISTNFNPAKPDKVANLVDVRGALYMVAGGVYAGADHPVRSYVTLVRAVPVEEWKGSRNGRVNPETGYQGASVTWKGKTYVLGGRDMELRAYPVSVPIESPASDVLDPPHWRDRPIDQMGLSDELVADAREYQIETAGTLGEWLESGDSNDLLDESREGYIAALDAIAKPNRECRRCYFVRADGDECPRCGATRWDLTAHDVGPPVGDSEQAQAAAEHSDLDIYPDGPREPSKPGHLRIGSKDVPVTGQVVEEDDDKSKRGKRKPKAAAAEPGPLPDNIFLVGPPRKPATYAVRASSLKAAADFAKSQHPKGAKVHVRPLEPGQKLLVPVTRDLT
ncbi:MAG: putative metallopeptidase [Isosphaeraceae bacterium]|nr:putative metallopeptidase [Isosphaeraceae bacterium]